MAIRPAKRKLKIAFIFMPIDEIRPPVSLNSLCTSGDLLMDEIARRLARAHDVIAYCARRGDQQKLEQFDGVELGGASFCIARIIYNKLDL
jgi:hypothetical protein